MSFAYRNSIPQNTLYGIGNYTKDDDDSRGQTRSNNNNSRSALIVVQLAMDGWWLPCREGQRGIDIFTTVSKQATNDRLKVYRCASSPVVNGIPGEAQDEKTRES